METLILYIGRRLLEGTFSRPFNHQSLYQLVSCSSEIYKNQFWWNMQTFFSSRRFYSMRLDTQGYQSWDNKLWQFFNIDRKSLGIKRWGSTGCLCSYNKIVIKGDNLLVVQAIQGSIVNLNYYSMHPQMDTER